MVLSTINSLVKKLKTFRILLTLMFLTRMVLYGWRKKMMKLNLYLSVVLITSLTFLNQSFAASHPSCASLFLTSTLAYSPLYKNLMKRPLARPDLLSDIKTEQQPQFLIHPRLKVNSSNSERLAAIKSLSIKDIIAAPGHRLLQNPKEVEGLAHYISQSGGGNFQHDPLLLNVVINSAGKVQTVDLWNAHHRLVAYMKVGYQTLAEIPSYNFKILINGTLENGEKWGHFLSIGALDPVMVKNYSIIPVGGDIRVGTVSVDGQLTNFELGSRNTIGQLFNNTFRLSQPRIGVYLGTFDPVHEGHIDTVLQAQKQFSLDEVVVIPNFTPLHKPNASAFTTRLNMLKNRLALEEKVNLYIGESKPIVDQFGREPLIEQISQIYGTKNIYYIIGSDSFAKEVQENLVATSNWSYLVLPREKNETIAIPESATNKVEVGEAHSFGLSSTKIRQALYQGQAIEEQMLHPITLQYILNHNLYSSNPASQ